MRSIRIFFIHIVLIGLSLPPCLSQVENGKIALDKVLKVAQDQYSVVFTYLDEDVEGITIDPPATDLDLKQLTDYLTAASGLSYTIINERFIAVRKALEETFSLCGTVRETNSGVPIENAIISIGNRVTLSDEDGRFSWTLKEQQGMLTVQHMSFEPKVIDLTSVVSGDCIEISMDDKSTVLEEYTVQNYVVEGIFKKPDGSTVINSEQLDILPGLAEPDVLHAIQTLPGIVSANETVSDINIRGGTNDQNLILWNGTRVYQPGHFFGLISVFNPYTTKETTLTKNGTNASLGNGVSGTITTSTHFEHPRKASVNLGMSMISGDFVLKTPLSKKTSIQIAGRRSLSDFFESPTYSQYFDRMFRDTEVLDNFNDSTFTSDRSFYFYDYSVNFMHQFKGNSLFKINFLSAFNELTYNENGTFQVTDAKQSRLIQNSVLGNITYDQYWGSAIKTSIHSNVSSYRLEAQNADIFNDQILNQTNEVLDFNSKILLYANLLDVLSLEGGYEFSEVGILNTDEINVPNYSEKIKKVQRYHAAFGMINYSDRRNITNGIVGFRTTYFPQLNETRLEPRINVNHKLTEIVSVQVLAELKSQNSTQIIDFQSDFLGIEKRRWILANDEDIPLAKSKQLEVGLLFNQENLLFGLDLFVKDVKGITASSQGFQNQFQFLDASGKYDVIGLDFIANRRFENASLWFNYSLSKNTYEFKSLGTSVFPNNFDIRHILTSGLSQEIGNLEFSMGINFRTGRPYTSIVTDVPADGGIIEYSFPNDKRVKDYFRIDTSAKYNFNINNRVAGKVGFYLWNVTNQRNVFNVYYRLDDENNIQEVSQKALGITPNINFRLIF